MWGFGLVHELRLGFSKKIIPNINILVNFLEKKDNETSRKLLKIIYKNFNKNTLNLQNDYNEFQINNIEHIFNIKLDVIKNFDINDIYNMLEYVTIILSLDNYNIILQHLYNNIMNYYIDNYNNLKDDNIKNNDIFKHYKNNTELVNTIRNFLINKKLYNITKNKSNIETIIKLNTKNINKIKFFDNVKFNNAILYNLYNKYIVSNYYRFINGNLNFVILDKNESNQSKFSNILNNIDLNYRYDVTNDYTNNLNKITFKNIIKELKINFLNKISIQLSDSGKKELFPDFTKSSIYMKIILSQTHLENKDNNIYDVTYYQTLFIENIKYKLLSKNEILKQMEYLFDCYIYLSNQNINFMDLSSEFYLEKRYCFKINYPIKYLINMLHYNSIGIADYTQLLKCKNLNYKNMQIETVIKEVEIYQNIYIKLLNEIYKNSIYSIYGEIVEMLGGDKNLIYINRHNNLDNIIYNNDYFGSYRIRFTMPSTTLNNFVNEHIQFAKLLQWCEPLFFAFYTNYIYNEFGTAGYGTSDPDLLKPTDIFKITHYYDETDENILLDNIKKFNIIIKEENPILANLYDKNDKKILKYDRLLQRHVTIEEIQKRYKTNKKVKTYLDILWKNTNKEKTILWEDLRSPYWKNNFKKQTEWRNIIIKKKNGKFYKYYFNYVNNTLSDTPSYNKIQNSDRIGFQFRFDNMDIKFIYNIMFFCVLVYIAIINKKKDNLSKAIQSQCWNNTIANCLIHGVNKFKLSNEYTEQLCDMLEINNIYKDNMVDFFQHCVDELHKKYKNHPIFKKLVKNNEFNVKIPNINLYFYELNKIRQQNEQLIL